MGDRRQRRWILLGNFALLLVSACGGNSTPPPPLTNSLQPAQQIYSSGGLNVPNSGTPIYQMSSTTVTSALQSNLNGYGSATVTAVSNSNYIIDPTYANSGNGQTPLRLIGSPITDSYSPTTLTVTGSGSGSTYQMNIISSDGSTSQTLYYVNSLYVGPVQLVTTSNTAMFQGTAQNNGQSMKVIAKVNGYQSHGGFSIQEFFVSNLGTVWSQGANYPTSNTSNGGSQLSVREVDLSVSFQYPNYAMSNQGGFGNGNFGQTPNVGIGYQYPTY